MIDIELKERQSIKIMELLGTSMLADCGIVHSDLLQQQFKKYQSALSQNGFRITFEILVWLELWYRSVMGEPKGGDKSERTQRP